MRSGDQGTGDGAAGEVGRPAGPYGVRLDWTELPEDLRGWVAEQLGSPVVRAETQQGGFSPAAAARLRCADGSTGFVKAVSPDPNPHAPDLLRREIAVLGQMPPGLGVPRLIGSLDDGHWVVLLVQDVPGRHPLTPWVDAEVRATLAALTDLQRHPAPTAWPALEGELHGEFGAWARVAQMLPPDLDPWLATRLGALDDLSLQTLPALAGDGVCHVDTRADNLLVEPAGAVRVVDWPWAARGAPWFDAASLLVNLELFGGVEPTAYLPQVRALGATDEQILGTVAGLCGFFTEAARLPPIPGLPTLRAFQGAQARAATRLLQRLGKRSASPLA